MILITTLIKWCIFVKKLTRKFNEFFAKNKRINMIFVFKKIKKDDKLIKKSKKN